MAQELTYAMITPYSISKSRTGGIISRLLTLTENLELVAALAVNDPGFPVLHDDANGSYSLTAAGVLADQAPAEPAVEQPAVELAVFDEFLNVADRRERAEHVQRIYHDLLQGEEGCGCNV